MAICKSERFTLSDLFVLLFASRSLSVLSPSPLSRHVLMAGLFLSTPLLCPLSAFLSLLPSQLPSPCPK